MAVRTQALENEIYYDLTMRGCPTFTLGCRTYPTDRQTYFRPDLDRGAQNSAIQENFKHSN